MIGLTGKVNPPKGVAAKLKYFTEHKDEFDTVIVGTSRLYYAASPQIFDATTREKGLPTRTFNFGIDAMHPPENFYVLDQILRTKPRNLKWVLLELGEVSARWHDILGTQRALYWHDWPRTKLTLIGFFSREPFADSIDLAQFRGYEHLKKTR